MRHELIPFVVPAIGAGLLVAWASAGEGTAPPAERPAPRCFLASQVNGFSSHGTDAVDVHVGANHTYRLSLGGVCPDVDWSLRVGIRTLGGSSWICEGADAEIIVPSPNGRQRCLVTAIRPLSAAEVAASRQRHR